MAGMIASSYERKLILMLIQHRSNRFGKFPLRSPRVRGRIRTKLSARPMEKRNRGASLVVIIGVIRSIV